MQLVKESYLTNYITGLDSFNYLYSVGNHAKTSMNTIQMTGMIAADADEELGTTCIGATVRH